MAFIRLTRACLILCLIGAASPAWSHPVRCFPRDTTVESLRVKFGERWIGHAADKSGRIRYELWRGEKSWTFFFTDLPGAKLACFLAGGKHWKVAK